MTTIHQECIQMWKIYKPEKKIQNKKKLKLMKSIANQAILSADRINSYPLYRDYRPEVGSGRSADWLNIGFEHYSVVARTIYRDTKWSGNIVRICTKAIRTFDNCYNNLQLLEKLPIFPDSISLKHWGSYSEKSLEQISRNMSSNVKKWYLYKRYIIGRAIAEYDGKKRLEAISKNPQYKISGYLAASILKWQKGETGYEGCSGCESYTWHQDHPEQWDLLMKHAPIGDKGDGWEQVFPHEIERINELLDKGWHETLRMNDSIFTVNFPHETVDFK